MVEHCDQGGRGGEKRSLRGAVWCRNPKGGEEGLKKQSIVTGGKRGREGEDMS